MEKENIRKQDIIVESVKSLYNEKGMTETIRQVCAIAITKKEARLCYKLAEILYKEDVMQDLQKVVLEGKDAVFCYVFARDVNNANIKELQKVVLEDKNAVLCYLFARDVNNANVKELQKVVVDSNDAFLCYMFARYIKGAEIKPLQQVVINSRNKELCEKFAQFIERRTEWGWGVRKAVSNVTAPCDAEKIEEDLDSIIDNK